MLNYSRRHTDVRIQGSATDDAFEQSADVADEQNVFEAIMHRSAAPPLDETIAQREVRFLVVDPSLMGQGVAS